MLVKSNSVRILSCATPRYRCLKGETFVSQAVLTRTPLQRLFGLAFRQRLGAEEALWLKPCYSIHTWGMRFPLDVVFLDSSGRILGLLEDVRPWRICRTFVKTRSVLEMNSGTITDRGLKVGDNLTFLPETESSMEQGRRG